MIKKGKIIKGIGGFYYVLTADALYECKARGKFKNNSIKLLVGDIVDIDTTLNSIVNLYERKNFLIRPAISNVDQIILFMSSTYPKVDFFVLDKLLINNIYKNIHTLIVFNKIDEASEEDIENIKQVYSNSGYRPIFISAKDSKYDDLLLLLKGKTSVLSGNSGVGKSTFINSLLNNESMEVGAISNKIKRGKHTTRHSEIFKIDDDTYIADTPGYGKMDIHKIEPEDLKDYYNEFMLFSNCQFNQCSHIHEPSCEIIEAVKSGLINRVRYENYCKIYEELKRGKHERY